MRAAFAVVLASAASAGVAASTPSPAVEAVAESAPAGVGGRTADHPTGSSCRSTYTYPMIARAARSVYRSPSRVTRTEKRHLRRFRRCARTHRTAERGLRRTRTWLRWRRSYRGFWLIRWERVPAWLRATLRRIAACESGGNPRAVSPNGLYAGLYQFNSAAWRSVGGRGSPRDASPHEQGVRAARLYRQRGPQPWPVCGR